MLFLHGHKGLVFCAMTSLLSVSADVISPGMYIMSTKNSLFGGGGGGGGGSLPAYSKLTCLKHDKLNLFHIIKVTVMFITTIATLFFIIIVITTSCTVVDCI